MMKKYFAQYLLTITIILSLMAFKRADDPFADLIKKLEEYIKKYPIEKVHLHLDKPYFGIGDDIWFKAYVTNGTTKEPSGLSNILYVELINEKDSLQKQIKLNLKGGIAWGDFKLSDSLTEGNYRIRAYTQWMRNAGPSFFFDKVIKVGNSWTNAVISKASFTNQKNGQNNQVNANLTFTQKNGQPLSNQDVNFQINLDGNKKTTGKLKTSPNGTLNIAISNTSVSTTPSGFITTNFTLTDGKIVTKTFPIKSISSEPDVQFLPEGGTFIEGLPTKIAVKAVNADGKGENIKGKVVDQTGNEILDFETTHNGMGSFTLTADAGKLYNAQIKFNNGISKSIKLPTPNSTGYAMAVNATDTSKISTRIMLSADLVNKGELNLLAHQNGLVLFAAKVPTSRQIASISIPKADLPSGIVTLTLFAPDQSPAVERLVFVANPNDRLQVAIENLKPNYTKKENVSVGINSSAFDKPTQGSFSVAVTQMDVVKPDVENESNIYATLLLTSDLKGYIEKPNFYFMNQNLDTRIALDHLLLTQGWRKLDWNQIKAGTPTPKFAVEKGLKISGTITNSGKPVANGKVSLFSSSVGLFAADTLTDANGRFNFNDISFSDGTKFAIKAINAKDSKNVKIVMDDVPGQEITTNPNTGDIEINVNEQIKPYLESSTAYYQELERSGQITRVNRLKTVEIIGEKKNKAPNSSNLNGPGNADAVFDFNDFQSAVSLGNFLNGRVAGIHVTNGVPASTRNGGQMTVLVDGIVFIDGNNGETATGNLDELTMGDIESIEVLKSIAMTTAYGHSGSNGVILITTKTGQGRPVSTFAPGMLSYSPKGLFANRQFYSPKYDSPKDTKVDLRTTVYWNPHIVTDVAGKATFNFYNTDKNGKYRMVIEGIDALGNLAHEVFFFNVN